MEENNKQYKYILKASIVHNNKFDYSKVIYENRDSYIKIICKDCNTEFYRNARIHLEGSGCPTCKPSARKDSKESFLQKSINVHGDLYNYDLVKYINTRTKVEIICNRDHGSFKQFPKTHIEGHGCPKCALIYIASKHTKPFNEFIKESKNKYDDKFIYIESEYVNFTTVMKIICTKHGEFFKKPKCHLNFHGCERCKEDELHEYFLNKSKRIHGDKYFYELVKFKYLKDKIKINCKLHNTFHQTADSHLNGNGCPKCARIISNGEVEWLDYLKIPYDYRHKNLKINNKYFSLDAVDEINKIIYEYNGDFWHGNPNIYDKDKINNATKNRFGDLYQKTLNKENFIKDAGYQIISIWESDWKKLKLNLGI